MIKIIGKNALIKAILVAVAAAVIILACVWFFVLSPQIEEKMKNSTEKESGQIYGSIITDNRSFDLS